jgi:hypothetical protein
VVAVVAMVTTVVTAVVVASGDDGCGYMIEGKWWG